MAIPTHNGSPIPVISLAPNDAVKPRFGMVYRTTVTESLDTTEERQTRRPRALYRLQFTTAALNPAELNQLRTVIETAGDLPVACPLWPVKVRLTAAVSAAATALVLEATAGCLFDVFPDFAILWNDFDDWEIVELDAMGATSCTLSAALANGYPAGALLVPIVYGHVPRGPVEQLTDELGVWVCEFTETFHRLHDQSVPEDVAVDHQVPGVPTSPAVSNPAPGYLFFTWVADPIAASYTIQRKLDAGDFEDYAVRESGSTSMTDQPTVSGTYCYRVRSVGECGEPSDWTAEQCIAFTYPGDPGDLPQLDQVLLWLDAADAPATVDVWPDQSGTGNNASQPYAPYQPVTLSNQINSLPAVFWNDTIGGMTLDDRAYDFSAGLTFFAVYRMTNANGYRMLLLLDDDHPTPYTISLSPVDVSSTGYYVARAAGTLIVGGSPLGNLAADTWQLVTIVHSATERRYYVNGALIDTATAASTPGNQTRRFNGIGGRSGAGGPHDQLWLAEEIILGIALTDSEREAWEAALLTKYALP